MYLALLYRVKNRSKLNRDITDIDNSIVDVGNAYSHMEEQHLAFVPPS